MEINQNYFSWIRLEAFSFQSWTIYWHNALLEFTISIGIREKSQLNSIDDATEAPSLSNF